MENKEQNIEKQDKPISFKREGGYTSSPRKKKKIIVGVLIAVAVIFTMIVVSMVLDVMGIGGSSEEKTISIPKGASTSAIASILKENKIISQPSVFRIYSKMQKADGTYQYGEFVLRGDMGYREIIQALKTPQSRTDTVKVVFPEGSTLEDIAKKLEENNVCSAEEFIEKTQKGSFGYHFEEQIPNSNLRFYQLEGYLFPASYEFYLGEPVDSVIDRFLAALDSRLTDEINQRLEELDMTLDECLTLAAIIQKESSDTEEMKKISSVFWNRLNNPSVLPCLQSDTTYFYIYDYIQPSDRVNKDKIIDAYNSYEIQGLPEGPICSPGMDAIMAALYPEDTPYYYFVSDKNMKFYYGKTYAEHEKNIQIAEQAGIEHGTDTQGE